MNQRRTAPQSQAQPSAAPAATWQWPPAADDLSAIACVDLRAAKDGVWPEALLPPRARRSTSPAPAASIDADTLRWPPPAAEVDAVTSWSVADGALRPARPSLPPPATAVPVAPTRSVRRSSSLVRRSRIGGLAIAAAVSGVLLGAPLLLRDDPPTESASAQAPRASVSVPQAAPTAAARTTLDMPERPAVARSRDASRPAATPPTAPRLVTADLVRPPASRTLTVAVDRREAGELSTGAAPPRVVESEPTPAVVPAALRVSTQLAGSVAGAHAPSLSVPRPPEATAPTADSRAGVTRLATVPARVNLEEPRIQTVLARYGDAYSRLDAAAARAVWPSVDARALSRAFNALRSQALVLDHCEIAVSGDRAQAACRGTSTYVPRVGDPTPRREPRQWRFELARTDEATWQIRSAESRQQ